MEKLLFISILFPFASALMIDHKIATRKKILK